MDKIKTLTLADAIRVAVARSGLTLNEIGEALDIDPKTHPAWTGGNQQVMDRAGRVSRFKKKFDGMF
jgi:ribosomal protein L31